MPHEQLHGVSRLLEKSIIVHSDALKCRAVKNVMLLVTHSPSVAASTDAHVPCKGRPASLHRQIMRAHPELHEGPQSSDGHEKTIIWLRAQNIWLAKQAVICTKFGTPGKGILGETCKSSQACCCWSFRLALNSRLLGTPMPSRVKGNGKPRAQYLARTLEAQLPQKG